MLLFPCVQGVLLFLKTDAGGLAETVRNCQTARVISLEAEVNIGRQENFRSDEEFGVQIYLSRLVFDMLLSASVDCEKRLLASSCLSVCPHGTNSTPTGRISVKFDT
jgi:hypothetical protein